MKGEEGRFNLIVLKESDKYCSQQEKVERDCSYWADDFRNMLTEKIRLSDFISRKRPSNVNTVDKVRKRGKTERVK